MTIHDAGRRLLFQLYEIYDNREAANIADLVMENVTGWSRIDRVVNRDVKISEPMFKLLERYADELLTRRPVQYVLNESHFLGMKMYVDENVLIPRPETEELVQWMVNELKKNNDCKTILDVGTGSGCIAIAVKKNIENAQVYGMDVSEGALRVAQRNASQNGADVQFILSDILDEKSWDALPRFDAIVSNPPYIPLHDKEKMSDNVVSYEPHIALFVPDSDATLFYDAIARFGQEKLEPAGKIFVELHEELSEAVRQVFARHGFKSIEIKKDMQGKNRMLRASRG
jgi:release factor glutamine methyltransferase